MLFTARVNHRPIYAAFRPLVPPPAERGVDHSRFFAGG
jgi:hypothetical protein